MTMSIKFWFNRSTRQLFWSSLDFSDHSKCMFMKIFPTIKFERRAFFYWNYCNTRALYICVWGGGGGHSVIETPRNGENWNIRIIVANVHDRFCMQIWSCERRKFACVRVYCGALVHTNKFINKFFFMAFIVLSTSN